MNNYDIAHEFFYQDGEKFDKYYKSMSYNNDKFFSYSTIIGKKMIDKNGNKCLFLSNSNFSNTTAKHINYLRQACPFYNVLYIPVEYNQKDITIENTIEKLIENLDYYEKSKLSLKANRQEFIYNFTTILDINDNFKTIKKSIIKKYQGLFDILTNDESTKELKKKIAEKQKQDLLKLKKKINSYLKKYDLSTLAKMVYDYNDNTLDGEKDIKKAIKQYINPNDDLSFVWSDGENFKTSKNITMSKNDCDLIIKLYKAGKLKHGFQLGYYTVLEVSEKFLKIGCHKIPVENINCLI